MHFSSFLFFYNWRPPLFVIPIRAIYDPEVEIPDSSDSSKTPPGEEEDRVEFSFSSESSDSSDLDMMKGPCVNLLNDFLNRNQKTKLQLLSELKMPLNKRKIRQQRLKMRKWLRAQLMS